MPLSKAVKPQPPEGGTPRPAWRIGESGLSLEATLAPLARLTAGGDPRGLIEALVERLHANEATIEAQRRRIAYLEGLSMTDELTGLLNRRGFQRELERALARARRRRETGLLLLGDLNGFKTINDRFGHGAGDAALASAADALARGIRRNDSAARIGGDEFAVLVADAGAAQAPAIVDKLEGLVASAPLAAELRTAGLSISFGAVAYDAERDATELMAAADCALYRRKDSRRPSN